MSPQEVRLGVHVRVAMRHRIQERRGMVGTVVGRYGGEDYLAVDVRFADGHCRLFWPQDLEEISSPISLQRSWWRSLLGGSSSAQQ
jgi:hypothetical protein